MLRRPWRRLRARRAALIVNESTTAFTGSTASRCYVSPGSLHAKPHTSRPRVTSPASRIPAVPHKGAGGAAYLANFLRQDPLDDIEGRDGSMIYAGGGSSSGAALKPELQRHQPLRRQRASRWTSPAAFPTSTAVTSASKHASAGAEDDDIVLDTPASLLPCLSTHENAACAIQELRTAHAQQQHRTLTSTRQQDADLEVLTPEQSASAHPAARGVGQDVIDLVTDVFTAQRDAEVKRRRELLYELTHPNPADYTYKGKLIPPPPLSFGQITEEARSLGNKMMLGQHYSLVRQAGTRASADDFDFHAAASTEVSRTGTSVSPASQIETAVGGQKSGVSSSASAFRVAGQQRKAYRSRAREENIFRDHNYFFEVQDLYQEIVLVGKACAGKSSLLNSLLGQNLAKTSSTPNTTRKISFYQSVTPEQLQAFHAKEHHNQLVKLPGGGLQLTFVDMPGYGIEGMSEQWRDAAIELTDAYFGVRRSVNTVLYCMDCERGLTKTDIKYFEWLENVQGTFFVVLTKCDGVPHSRITSVMRQVYTLITGNRRKYRKVFPYIIPTSAKDGTNVELLRGLITETSGMILGDTLRDLLQQKKAALTETALREEAGRLEAARLLERAQAKSFFELTHGTAAPLKRESGEEHTRAKNFPVSAPHSAIDRALNMSRNTANAAKPQMTSSPSPSPSLLPSPVHAGTQRYVLPLGHDNTAEDATAVAALLGNGGEAGENLKGFAKHAFPTPALAEEAAAARRDRRERFLAWRRAHPLATAQLSYDVPMGAATKKDGDEVESATFPLPEAGNARDRMGEAAEDVEKREAQTRVASAGEVREASKMRHTAVANQRGGRYRLNTGLENPQAAQTVVEVPMSHPHATEELGWEQTVEPSCAQPNEADGARNQPSPSPPLSSNAAVQRSSVIGFTPGSTNATPDSAPPPSADMSQHPSRRSGGPVSQFLTTLEGFQKRPNLVTSAKQRRKEARWQERQQKRHKGLSGRAAAEKGSACGGRGLVVEDASGRLSAYQAGKPCGPALVSATASSQTRQAEWKTEQLKELLRRENPEAPWLAMDRLRRKLRAREEEAALSGMRKKEVAAYVRDVGRVTESFDKFEGEVTAAKYMNETRQARTLRSQQQMHLNATAKISYRSMPPGLWKRYGEKDTYWPTPRVLGRAQDESHKP